ncbi:Gfo/Idh/MocA family protein [Parasphaerochaeta coccoides]|uniref:Trans-1,2-dihydrobenzene-1,2-diol dehydrogenase n=1 Tax=Parasphaerochaeta coccoides (strain ATCC BAA-1237 / DSM 17374 / SPN1) TaxID=760011 RepID=F4GM24_PARC1|nr:Gfo/Idh/MocA family oxidoreductase [Parasphaerochaeta coccoides]AEC02499.1 Trans-1,2-dihydrobenzene-1,2-diol dehydrogenase [Parasphaerochaeta coccoides DSM 17374]
MRFAILGAGGIARKMAATVIRMEGVEAYAVASRDGAKAEGFAREFGFARSYGSYEKMLDDPKVDLVYIATPHSHHHDHAIMAMKKGKAVLCEKAFSINADQAREMVCVAKENSVLLAEAIWTRYMPSCSIINGLVSSGVIGTVTSLTANLGYPVGHVERLRELALAGGSLLDLGVYPLNFALMVFGRDIVDISSSCVKTTAGVDARGNMTLTYADGRMADLHFNMDAATDRRGMIFGSKGYIEVRNINNPEVIRVFDKNHVCMASHEVPPQISGYEYEVIACRNALEKGQVECPEMPHEEIIFVMEIMDKVREKWGITFPQEA